jgi:superfamily I DNA/RNA helicase
MPWFVPYHKLDVDQKDFVDKPLAPGSEWIQGYAGTGKSVVLVHKLMNIYQNNPNSRCCIISFTHALLEMFRLGFEEAGLSQRLSKSNNICKAELGKIDLVTKYEFRESLSSGGEGLNYDFVFADEIQDLCPSDLKFIKNSGAKISIVSGDKNQSIYSEDPQDKELTLADNQISEILNPAGHRLTYLHRLTPSILNCVRKLVPQLEDELRDCRINHNRDTDVLLAGASTEKDEVAYVYEQALNYAQDIELTAILIPKHLWVLNFCRQVAENLGADWNENVESMFKQRDYTGVNEYFAANQIKLEFVGNDHGSFRHARDNNNVIIMTYHSAKGMDFQNVFIPFLSISRHEKFDFFIPRPLMVAMTRSNYNLTISYSGEPMACVELFREACMPIEIHSSDSENFEDPFDLPF